MRLRIACRRSARCRGWTSYLDALEERLARTVATHPGLVAAVGNEALAAGGNGCGRRSSSSRRRRERSRRSRRASRWSFVHMATLVHDDLIDRAHFRRGKAAAWSIYGPRRARATGDYLFARAFAELSETGDAAAVEILADATLCLARGEALQRTQTRDPRHERRGVSRALRPQDREAVRGGVPARRRLGRVRPRARDRVPDRGRRPRLLGRDDRDGEDRRHRPPRRDADPPAPARRAAGRRRPRRARRRARWTARSCALPRPALSTRLGAWPSTTLGRPGRGSTASCTETSSRP